MVGSVGEQAQALRASDAAAQLPARIAAAGTCCLRLAPVTAQHPVVGQTLLQQQAVRGHSRDREKAPLHALPTERIAYREHAHAEVVGHIAAHDLTLPPAAAAWREVDRLIKAVTPAHTELFQAAQVPHRAERVDPEREKA